MSGNFENITRAQLPDDAIAAIVPFLHGDTDDLEITSLPNEVIHKIISFLPQFPSEATGRQLKEVYKSLALARLQRRHAKLFTQHTSDIKYIDPFPGVQHTESLANITPYAELDFLFLLVSICPGLYSLRAPSVKGVLGCVRSQLKELSFIDDGLKFDDLRFLSRSSLTIISVTNPSWVVLSELSGIKTLKRVSLFSISSDIGSSAVQFLNATRASYLLLDLCSFCDEDLNYLLHHLPALQTFFLKCQIRHAWNALKYLRKVAREIENVYMIVDGVRIAVQKNDASHRSDNARWEASVWQRLMCRREIRTNPGGHLWPQGMSLRELDLDLQQDIYKHHSCHPENLDKHFLNCSESAPVDIDFTVRLGRKIPSKRQTIVRANWIKESSISEFATTLVISQDLIRYGSQDCDHWVHDFLEIVLSNFTKISTLHICKPSRFSKKSGKFILALSDFLQSIMEKCKELKTIYLEDSGDLVLQTKGASVLRNEKKLKETLKQVMLSVKEKERISKIDMGTIIAQLEIWASKKFEVDPTVVKHEMIR